MFLDVNYSDDTVKIEVHNGTLIASIDKAISVLQRIREEESKKEQVGDPGYSHKEEALDNLEDIGYPQEPKARESEHPVEIAKGLHPGREVIHSRFNQHPTQENFIFHYNGSSDDGLHMETPFYEASPYFDYSTLPGDRRRTMRLNLKGSSHLLNIGDVVLFNNSKPSFIISQFNKMLPLKH